MRPPSMAMEIEGEYIRPSLFLEKNYSRRVCFGKRTGMLVGSDDAEDADDCLSLARWTITLHRIGFVPCRRLVGSGSERVRSGIERVLLWVDWPHWTACLSVVGLGAV